MKRFALVAIVLFSSFSSIAFAQKLKLTNEHVGVFNSVSYDSSLNHSSSADLRVAAEVVAKVDSVISFYFRGVFLHPGNGFAHFWLQEKYKDLTFKAGLMPRPITSNRVPSVSHDAQFEAKGTTPIPGAATGIVFVQKIDALLVSVGTYYLPSSQSIEYDGSVEMQLGGSCSILAGGFYSREKYGIAGTFKCEYGKITGYWDSENTISGVTAVNIGSYGALFCTGIYDYTTEKPSHLQFGWVRDFSIPITILSEKVELQYLAGFGYVTTEKKLNVYLWIYF